MLLLLPVTHPLLDGLYELHQPPAITAPATPVATADKTPTTSPSPANQTTTSQTPPGNGSGGTPAGTTTPAQPVCVTTYARSKWQFVREERKAVEQRDLKWLHYERTVTDRCTGDSWTETKVEGPFDLWQSVPDSSITDVDHPDGAADGVSGSPLQSYSIPDLPNGVVEPSPAPQAAPKSVTSPSPKPPVFPSAALLVGAIVAAWEYRWRRGRRPIDVADNTVEPTGEAPQPEGRRVTLPSRSAFRTHDTSLNLPLTSGSSPKAVEIPPDLVGPINELKALLAELDQRLRQCDPTHVELIPPNIRDLCERIEQVQGKIPSEIADPVIRDGLKDQSALVGALMVYLKEQQLNQLKEQNNFKAFPQFSDDESYKAYAFLSKAADAASTDQIQALRDQWNETVTFYTKTRPADLQNDRCQVLVSAQPGDDLQMLKERLQQIADEESAIGSKLAGRFSQKQQKEIDERYKQIAREVAQLSACFNEDVDKPTSLVMKQATACLDRLNELKPLLTLLAPYVSNQKALDASVTEALKAETVAKAPKNGGATTGGMVLDVPLLKQWDSLWGEEECRPKKMKDYGCAITSIAMVINYYKPHTIETTEDMVRLRESITNEAHDCTWGGDKDTQAYMSRRGLEMSAKRDISQMSEEDLLKTLYANIEKGVPTIVGVEGPPHWVVVTGYTGTDPTHLRLEDFTINDPGADRFTLKDYRDYYSDSTWDGLVTIERSTTLEEIS